MISVNRPKTEEIKELADKVDEFLAQGGTIKQISPTVTGIKEDSKRTKYYSINNKGIPND